MEYGVNVSNKFAFLSGDEDVQDPDELIAKAEQAKKAKASALKKDVKKTVEKKVTIAAPLHSTGNKENVDRRPPRRDGPRNNNAGFERKGVRNHPNRRPDENNGDAVSTENRPPRNNRPPREPRDGQPRDGAPRFNNADRNGPGVRRFRGPRPQRTENSGDVVSDENHPNGGNRDNRPPRFRRNNNGVRGDRTSGSDKTGVRPVPKKDGFGRGNWGTENDEVPAEADPANADAPVNQSSDNVDVSAENENVEAEPEVEQVRELTLEEYKAQHKSEQPNFNIRKPGEGGDKKIYQKLVPLKRVDSKKTEEVEDDVQTKREPREKALNIEVSFNDPQRNRGPRGFRDDRRGDGFREGNRGGQDRRQGGAPAGNRRNQRGSQFNLTPESFPALGSH